ncbi:carbohydrate porin [Candidatus Binatus sp.]|uniref:carbohydrate porin n=1 Tax=Candidatus Binatus sp. TaxID=2811406 RepID=UPI003CC522A5
MLRSLLRIFSTATLILLCTILTSSAALAQIDYDTGDDTVFAHSETLPWWLSAQGNVIFQWHPSFHAEYSGPNSFEHASEQAASEVTTLYSGLVLSPSIEAVADVENAGGSGLSQTLGLAGFTDLDAIRDPGLSPAPYLARLWYRKVIALSDDTVRVKRTPISMLTTLPVRRLDIYVGEFDLVDFFDLNSVANDSHTQFMNWTVVNNGAYDYAADTRGYTWGAVIDYEDRAWGFRFAEALVSKRPNGLNLQKNLQDAHSENYELEFRPELIERRETTVRLLAFTNFANMGDYHEAIDLFEAGKTPTPEIDDHPMRTTLKYGFGINAEQEFTDYLRGFARAGWNEGEHESFNYTEVNETVAFGGDLRGTLWNRPEDKLGVAFVGNGLSQRHRQYLADGGLGFVLGDGGLSYGPEEIMESYYNFPIPAHPGFFGALDVQYINNPGYNRARGPVVVPGMRLHVEF